METKQMYSKIEVISSFAIWLGKELDTRHLNVAKLSKMSGVHKNTIYNYLYGRCEPTMFNAICLVNALGYDLGVISK